MPIKSDYLDILSNNDAILKQLIVSHPIPTLKQSDNFLNDLVKYIIFQQISTKAGNTIYNRFLEFYSFQKSDSLFKWEEKDWKKIGWDYSESSIHNKRFLRQYEPIKIL